MTETSVSGFGLLGTTITQSLTLIAFTVSKMIARLWFWTWLNGWSNTVITHTFFFFHKSKTCKAE